MAEPSPAKGRLGLYIPFVLAGLLIIGHAVYWHFVAGQIDQGAQAWIDEQEAAGYQIRHDGMSVEGYPFRFTLKVTAPDITAPLQDGGWRARFERLAGSAQFYDLNHWIVSTDGTTVLDAPSSQGPARYRLTTEQARLSLRSSGGATTRLGGTINGLTLATEAGPSPDIDAIESLNLSGIVSEDDALLMAFDAAGVGLTDGALAPQLLASFGQTINEVRGEARLTAFSALARVGDPAEWRAANGQLEIASAGLVWGPADLRGDGMLALDANLLLEGRLSVIVVDPEPLINALVETGLVTSDLGDALRLAVLVAPTREGGIAQSFRLRDGGVFWGPARLVTFAERPREPQSD